MARKKKRKLAFVPDAQQGSDSGNHVSWFGTADRLTDPSSHKVGDTSNDPLTGRNILTGAQETRREGAASQPMTPAAAFADAVLHGDSAQIKATYEALPHTLATARQVTAAFVAMPQDQRDAVVKNVDANAEMFGPVLVSNFKTMIQSAPPATRQHSTDPVAMTGQDAVRNMKESGLFKAGSGSVALAGRDSMQLAVSKGWWTGDRQTYAVNYLMQNAGLSEMGAKGLVSRWKNVEAPHGPGSVNPSSGASGIGQWLGSRKGGYTVGDFDSQLAKAAGELNGSEKAAGDVLRKAATADQAATGASMFERAEGYNASTGRDNYTHQTMAGIAGVGGATQIAGAGGQDVTVGGDRSGGAAALAAGIGNHGLRKGSGNVPANMALQSVLNDLGATDRFGHALKVDGRFGNRTYEAVKNYQTDAGIASDGVVGPQTFKHINSDMSPTHVGTEGSPELAGQVPYSIASDAPRFFPGPGPGAGPTARDYAAGMAVAAVTVDPLVSRAVRIPTGLDSGPVPADHPLRAQIEHVQNVSHWLDTPSSPSTFDSYSHSAFSPASDPYRPTGGSNGSFTGAVSGGSSSSGSFDSFAAGMSHTYQTVQSGGSVAPQPSYSVGGAGVYTPTHVSTVNDGYSPPTTFTTGNNGQIVGGI